MIVTDNFVVLNWPKTGSTFIRHTLKELYEKRENRLKRFLIQQKLMKSSHYKELLLPILWNDLAARENRHNQHGAFSQIPTAHKNKTVVAAVRNPFDRIVSMYEFSFWKKHPHGDEKDLKKDFPNYPDITFDEFYQMTNKYGRHLLLGDKLSPKVEVGTQTIEFIKFFFENPTEIINEKLTDDYIDSGAFKKDLPDIKFLHTENLNQELHDFLLTMKLPKAEVDFIVNKGRINVSKRRSKKWENYISPETQAMIRQKERMLFMLFPEYAS